MALYAIDYFDTVTRIKRGRKTYFLNEGLKYLGYTLHPLQDKFAHTPDRCYLIPKTGIWSHVRPEDITDDAEKRFDQLKATERATKKLLKYFMDMFGSLLK